MGKYSGKLDGLPGVPVDNNYQFQVDQLKKPWIGKPVQDIAWWYRQLRAQKMAMEQAEKDINAQLEAARQLLVVGYEDSGITSLKLKDGASIAVESEPYAQVEDKEAYRRWCVENGYEAEMSLAWQTTNAIVKETLLAGRPFPPGVKCYVREKMVLRGGSQKQVEVFDLNSIPEP